MKKKLTLTFLVLVCAICCAFGLVACGVDDGSDNKSALASNEFEAEFNAAIESGYTFTYTFTATHTYEADVVNNRYLTSGSGAGVTTTNKMLYAKVGDKYYYYMSEANGDWWLTGIEISESLFNKNISNYGLDETEDNSLWFKGFSQFTDKVVAEKGNLFKSDGENKYVANNVSVAEVGKANKIEIELNNGALVSFNVTNYLPQGWSGKDGTDYSFTKFGETTVAMPDDDHIVDVEMNAEQWNACLNAFAATKNFSLQMKNKSGNIVGAMKLDGDTYYETQGENAYKNDNIYDKKDDKFYKYSVVNYKYIDNTDPKNRVWNKTEIDSDAYNKAVLENACNLVSGAATKLATNYAEFSYKHNVYSLDTLEIAKGFTIKDVKITVKNGAVKKAECIWAGVTDDTTHTYTTDRYVTIYAVGTTDIEFITIPDVVFEQTFVLKDIWFTTDSNRYEVPKDIKDKCNASKEKALIIGKNGEVGGAFDFGFGAVGEFTGDTALTIAKDVNGHYKLTPVIDDYKVGYITYDRANGELQIYIKYAKGEAAFTFVWQQP